MSCEMNFVRIFTVILLTLIAEKCESKAEGFSCPDLIKPNTWEIEEFFGTWSAVESFMHVENGMVKAEDLCSSMIISEVNESGEPMTYTKSADLYNSPRELRYLQINFNDEANSRTLTYILSFYNQKKMYWKGNDTIIQVIKFDKKALFGGKSIMATICKPKEEVFYSVLYDNRNGENIADDRSTNFNHLLLMQKKFKRGFKV